MPAGQPFTNLCQQLARPLLAGRADLHVHTTASDGAATLEANNPPCDIYPCAPGGPNDYVYVYTSRANPQHWPRLLEAIGRKELIGDARFATAEARVKNQAELDRIITDFTSKRDKYECMRVIGAAVPAGEVRETLELIERLGSTLADGRNLLIHCRGGLGRAPLIAACLLASVGVPPSIAFQRISAARGVSVPETEEQSHWADDLASQLAPASPVPSR